MWRFNSVAGIIPQIVLGFGIGSGVAALLGATATLDFSRSANSSLIPMLRRF